MKEKIEYVRRLSGWEVPEDEALEMYNVFKSYRDEGYSISYSRMMAGFATAEDTGEY